MVYTPLARLPYWGRKFDVVIAGAILEHLSDPVSVIGNLAGLAREAVIIGFTPVADSDGQFMETANDWTDPVHNFTFWTLSRGLYKRIFANLGFSVDFVPAKARLHGQEYTRQTIIGRRQGVKDTPNDQDITTTNTRQLGSEGIGNLMSEVDLEEFNTALSGFTGRVPDSIEYQRLCEISLRHPLTHRLRGLDPFSETYKATVLQLYRDLRGDDRDYDPQRDEQSGLSLPQNLWSGASPWSFRDSTFVAEFLLSWGQIMRALALPPGSDAKILEYGSGSGQLLLFLARLGLRTSAVDIDAASLELVRAQAAAMQLDVRTEQAAFGDGFGDETFDRIIFFESFHHAIDFGPLLGRLRQRLESRRSAHSLRRTRGRRVCAISALPVGATS